MGQTVRTPARPFHPLPPATAKLRDAALTLGVSLATAEKRLYGEHSVNLQCARLVEMMLRRGETEDVAKFLAPIEAARQGEPTGQLVDTLLAAAMADCHEDNAEARYHANPCRETVKALLDARAIERARSVESDLDLRAEWGL